MKDRDFEKVMEDFFKELEYLPYDVYQLTWKKITQPYNLFVDFDKPSDAVSDDIKIVLIKRMKTEHEQAMIAKRANRLMSL